MCSEYLQLVVRVGAYRLLSLAGWGGGWGVGAYRIWSLCLPLQQTNFYQHSVEAELSWEEECSVLYWLKTADALPHGRLGQAILLKPSDLGLNTAVVFYVMWVRTRTHCPRSNTNITYWLKVVAAANSSTTLPYPRTQVPSSFTYITSSN